MVIRLQQDLENSTDSLPRAGPSTTPNDFASGGLPSSPHASGHLPKGGPFLLVGLIQAVVVFTVHLEDVGRAQFEQRLEGHSGSIPETHCAIFMPEERRDRSGMVPFWQPYHNHNTSVLFNYSQEEFNPCPWSTSPLLPSE